MTEFVYDSEHGAFDGKKEVCPVCNVVCNVGCDFWCFVKLKRGNTNEENEIQNVSYSPLKRTYTEQMEAHGDLTEIPVLDPLLEGKDQNNESVAVTETIDGDDGQSSTRTSSDNCIIAECVSMSESDKNGFSYMHNCVLTEDSGTTKTTCNLTVETGLPEDSQQSNQVTPLKSSDERVNEQNSPTRVQFSPKLVSEVHFRDKVDFYERSTLFHSVFDESRFRMERAKEINRAKARGMTWTEWMEQRTDEDVQQEERYGANPFR